MTTSYKSVLLQALSAAGKILAKNVNAKKIISHKGSEAINIVTQVDKAAEKAILAIIHKNFPDHSILAEESGSQEGTEFKWIIDPLDGTINYAHSLPMSTVSIGLERRGQMIMGGVLDPFRKELFFAEKGKGARLNGKKMRVSLISKFNEALLCTGFPYDQKQYVDYYLSTFKRYLVAAQAVRRYGSAAMDLCWLACGRFDGFWEEKLYPWDTAAATLIVEEAGGKITDFKGKPYSIYHQEILASNGRIHDPMLEVVR